MAETTQVVLMRDFTTIRNGITGSLQILDPLEKTPFEVKRFFIVSNLELLSFRGNHAHRECEQLIFVLSGTVEFSLEYAGKKVQFILGVDGEAVYCPKLTWIKYQALSPNAAICVLASHAFSEEEVLNNYGEFLKETT